MPDKKTQKMKTENKVLKLVNERQQQPEESVMDANIDCITEELYWLVKIIDNRMRDYKQYSLFDPENKAIPIQDLFPIPQLKPSSYRILAKKKAVGQPMTLFMTLLKVIKLKTYGVCKMLFCLFGESMTSRFYI